MDTEDEAKNLAELLHFFEQGVPFNRWLGMRVESPRAPAPPVGAPVGTPGTEVRARGYCRVRVPFRAELVGDPFRPALHGGVLSTLADTAGGLALFLRIGAPRARISTLDLRIDYYEPARLADLYADAHVVRAGNRVGVSRIVLHHGDPDRGIAEGKGVYMIRPPAEARAPAEGRGDAG